MGSIGALTLVSRVFGVVRDTLQADRVGAGFASDAFLVAFRLPNMFRALFAEGAFSAAFVPMFNRKSTEGGGRPAGLLFAEQALALLLPILIIVTAIMLVAAWPVTYALSGGFKDPTPTQFDFAVLLSRITLPYLMLISLASLLGGILNSVGRYWVNAAAPILLNVSMCAALFFFEGDTPYETAIMQAASVTVGGIAQLIFLIWGCHRAGVSLKLRRPRINADMKTLGRVAFPAAIGAGAVQINLLISTALAGYFLDEGSISRLYYADRLNQLPLGMVGIGLATILLPTLSKMLGDKREAAALALQNRGVELALLLTLPATVAFLTASLPIVQGLFQRGEFSAADASASAIALSLFSIGLPAYVLIKVLTPGFYSREDTRTPVRYALVAVAVNIVLNLALIPTLGYIGPPIATAASAIINLALLYWTLSRRGHFKADRQLTRRVPRLIAAALLMGVVVWIAAPYALPYMTGSLTWRALGLSTLVGLGFAVYGCTCLLLGAFSLADLKEMMGRPEPEGEAVGP